MLDKPYQKLGTPSRLVRILLPGILSASALLAQAGDTTRGQTILEGKGACLTCHRVAGKGSRLGIDLSDVGNRRTRDVLEKQLVAPNPDPQFKHFRVVTSDGRSVSGKLFNQDIYSIQMLDSQERLVSFQKSQLKEMGAVPAPAMPSYEGKLTKEELADLVAYLTSLKGVVAK